MEAPPPPRMVWRLPALGIDARFRPSSGEDVGVAHLESPARLRLRPAGAERGEAPLVP